MLDEAANIAPVEDLATVASTSAAIGLQLVTVFQDLARVRSRYGDTAGTVVNNHRAALFLPGIKDLDTLELASRLIGEQEVDLESVTLGADGRRSSTTAAHWRRLLPSEDARTFLRAMASSSTTTWRRSASGCDRGSATVRFAGARQRSRIRFRQAVWPSTQANRGRSPSWTASRPGSRWSRRATKCPPNVSILDGTRARQAGGDG